LRDTILAIAGPLTRRVAGYRTNRTEWIETVRGKGFYLEIET
jgi:hypothetical protein